MYFLFFFSNIQSRLDRILERSKKTLDRLQHLNRIGLIPKRLLAVEDGEERVARVVTRFLENDEKYGYLTANKYLHETSAILNRKDSLKAKMRDFMQKLRRSNDGEGGVNDGDKVTDENTPHEMPGRIRIENVTVLHILYIYIYTVRWSLSR